MRWWAESEIDPESAWQRGTGRASGAVAVETGWMPQMVVGCRGQQGVQGAWLEPLWLELVVSLTLEMAETTEKK